MGTQSIEAAHIGGFPPERYQDIPQGPTKHARYRNDRYKVTSTFVALRTIHHFLNISLWKE